MFQHFLSKNITQKKLFISIIIMKMIKYCFISSLKYNLETFYKSLSYISLKIFFYCTSQNTEYI